MTSSFPGATKEARSKSDGSFRHNPEECVAFGDQYNDVEMLETVGMGYAMSNAAPGIAGHAKYITDSVEEVLEDILAGLDL